MAFPLANKPAANAARGCESATATMPNTPFPGTSQGAVRHGPLGLTLLASEVYGELRNDIEREGAMTWVKPAFDEIKMDAEAKSYSDGLTW
jgi:hypothetical protein